MIIYNDILGKLKSAGYSTAKIRNEKLLTESTLQRLRENQPISTSTLDKICELTGLQPADLLKYERKCIMEKKFKIINNELYAVGNAGFELDFENDTRHFDFSEWHLKDSEKDVNKALDGFYDLDNAFLCEDENGILYAVEYIYTSIYEKAVPMIWQKVKKI